MKRPKLIYKYTRITDHSVDSIKNSYLWFSSPDFLNDPFDLNYRYSESFMNEILALSVKQLKNDIINELQRKNKKINQESFDRQINDLLKNEFYIEQTMEFLKSNIQYSVCCFTEKFDNILMWSHYAEKHKGICLIYDLERDSKLLRKSPSWHYEEEWRILNMVTGKNELNVDALVGIIFGCNIEEQEKEELILICENLGIENFQYYQMKKHKKEYRLVRTSLPRKTSLNNGV